MTLFLNACVRQESRTLRLARRLLATLPGPVTELRLEEMDFPKADGDFLVRRDALLAQGRLEDPLFAPARQFAAADLVVIAAPFWDLSFPAALKQYLEQINVVGLTFFYTPEGVPQGLCRAKKLWYVTTAGGPLFCPQFGYGYVKALAQGFYGIPEVDWLHAEGLDVAGADVEAILDRAFPGEGK